MSRSSERMLPTAKASRPAVGVRAKSAATPLTPDALANARIVALSETDASTLNGIIQALPDPADLDAGTLIVIPGEFAGGKSLARSVLSMFGRAKSAIPRTRRCTALVARGYVDVGAAGEDCWGRVS